MVEIKPVKTVKMTNVRLLRQLTSPWQNSLKLVTHNLVQERIEQAPTTKIRILTNKRLLIPNLQNVFTLMVIIKITNGNNMHKVDLQGTNVKFQPLLAWLLPLQLESTK